MLGRGATAHHGAAAAACRWCGGSLAAAAPGTRWRAAASRGTVGCPGAKAEVVAAGTRVMVAVSRGCQIHLG